MNSRTINSKSNLSKVPLNLKYQLWLFNKQHSYFGVLVVIVILQIVVTLRTVAYGGSLRELEQTEDKVRGENKVLNQELVELSSLTRVEQKSIEMGFLKPQFVLYISMKDPVAQLTQ